MEKEIAKELIKSIEIAKESFKSSMEIYTESYAEVLSKLDLMAYLILDEEKRKA